MNWNQSITLFHKETENRQERWDSQVFDGVSAVTVQKSSPYSAGLEPDNQLIVRIPGNKALTIAPGDRVLVGNYQVTADSPEFQQAYVVLSVSDNRRGSGALWHRLKDTKTISEERGLSPKGALQQRLDKEVELKSRPYIPKKTGNLEKSGTASYPSIGFVRWDTPYARYQYYGHVMVGKKPKTVTDIPLKSHGGGLRGSRWFERMKVDCCEYITQTLAKLAGGKAK